MGFYGCIPRFIKAHGGWILTMLGIGGLGGTVALTALEAPKVQKAIREEWDDRMWELYNSLPTEERTAEKQDELWEACKLTFWEKVKISAPIAWPVAVAWIFTMACMIGAQIFNVKKQAALVAAYGALMAEFAQYREAIKAEFGEEADRRALEFSRKQIEDLEEEIKNLKEENGPFLYGIETLPGVVFEAKPGDIHEALMHFNRNLVLRGYGQLDELYEFIGIPVTAYDVKLASEYGYSQYENEVTWDIGYVDFGFRMIEARNGRKIRMITMSVPPYRVAGPGDDGDILEEYPDFEIVAKRARDLAASVLEQRDLTKIFHPEIWMDNLYLTAKGVE